MSIKLKGTTAGSAVILAAPADTSPTGTEKTLTLPTSVGSAEQFLKNSGTAGELEFSSMVETSTGVGIGTSAPSELLHIAGATNPAITLQDTTNNTDARIKTNNNGDLVFEADYNNEQSDTRIGFELDGSEKVRIDSSGNVGINTSSPNSLLSVKVADARQLDVIKDSGDDNLVLKCSAPNASNNLRTIELAGERVSFSTGASSGTAYTERMRIQADGTVGIGYSYPSCKLDVKVATSSSTSAVFRVRSDWQNTDQIQAQILSDGDVQNRNNSYGAISDAKLKENIVDANSQWEDIKNIRVRNYNFIVNEGVPVTTHIGVVAQELETVSPGLVSELPDLDNDGNDLGTTTKSVSYSVLYMKAVKALQEAQTRIETLESQHAAQQAQIDDLLARVTALEAAE